MKKTLAALLFVLQFYLILRGVNTFSKFLVPFFILSAFAVQALLYFRLQLSAYPSVIVKASPPYGRSRLPALCFALLVIALLAIEVRRMILSIPDPGSYSDTVPQLNTLYERFSRGQQPYYPLGQYPWHPFPVYMPLHWLPIGLAYLLHIDARWIGFLFFSFSYLVYAYGRWNANYIGKSALAALLPAAAVYGFVHWVQFDMAVSYEIIIAAYYLLLVSGLATENIVLITAGIVTCLLSRYTFLFWLPLFALVLWYSVPRRKSVYAWSAILTFVTLLYVIPFYSKDPTILQQGIKYHNDCYVNDWNGLGHPEQSAAFDQGLNLSYFTSHTFTGDMQHRVFMARCVQGLLMLLLFLAGLFLFRRWRGRIGYGVFSLGMLFCFLCLFYLFNPVTYRYYYLAPMVISAALCAELVLLPPGNPRHAGQSARDQPIGSAN